MATKNTGKSAARTVTARKSAATSAAHAAKTRKVSKTAKADAKPEILSRAPAINIGLSERDRGAIAKGLNRVLADTFGLYLTTHNFHWNVTGPHFNSLHAMFMGQYTELWNAIDSVAERIRSLGFYAPGSYKEFAQLASVPDTPLVPPKAEDMVRILVKGHETAARTARELFPLLDKASDEPTADLLTQRVQSHEQTAWMLRSLLEA
ncbi:MAG: DNA protection during starvation protein 2 [Paracidovorax wautersii]|uniref:DNA protection during starvation protein 2 n=1 Tax=Paracidovorax wautersii TaxID=1177982 RepID=A0A7V8FLU9_9BURK|nr:MAG: DNA protection during starvation protein 2 [Paracidovorax wautersii]